MSLYFATSEKTDETIPMVCKNSVFWWNLQNIYENKKVVLQIL